MKFSYGNVLLVYADITERRITFELWIVRNDQLKRL